MKKITFSLLFVLLNLSSFSVFSAQELSKESAEKLIPYKIVEINGNFTTFKELKTEAQKIAEAENAYGFYLLDYAYQTERGENTVNNIALYHKNAQEKMENYKQFDGIYEYPQHIAKKLIPFDKVELRGSFRDSQEIRNAIVRKIAAQKPYAFSILQQLKINPGRYDLLVGLYEKDAKQNPDADDFTFLSLASEFFDSILPKKNNKETNEIDVQTVSDENSNIVNLVERTNLTNNTETVKVIAANKKDAMQNEFPIEINRKQAKSLKPFDSITFRGSFANQYNLAQTAKKYAAQTNATHFHIKDINNSGSGNVIVTIDLYIIK